MAFSSLEDSLISLVIPLVLAGARDMMRQEIFRVALVVLLKDLRMKIDYLSQYTDKSRSVKTSNHFGCVSLGLHIIVFIAPPPPPPPK